MNILAKRIVSLSVIGVVLVALLVGNILAFINFGIISQFLAGEKFIFDGKDVAIARDNADLLCQKIMDEGIVLLKNENDALPLKENERKLNLFGWSSIDNGFLLRGVGSGSSTIRNEAKVTLYKALEDEGFELNKELEEMYLSHFGGNRPTDASNVYSLIEKPVDTIDQSIFDNAKQFSNIAIMVMSRNGGENIGEIPTYQNKRQGSGNYDNTRTYLMASKEEEDLLTKLDQEFEKVIVIMNTANYMHPTFLDDDRVDAAMFVGLTGQSGTLGIAHVLKGYTYTVNYDENGEPEKDPITDEIIKTPVEFSPSGKLSDILVYDPTQDPTWQNKVVSGGNIQYVEDIYYGYKWYETADKEGFFDDYTSDYGTGKGYGGLVQFPFGFGLSYTKFEWTVTDLEIPNGGKITKDSVIKIKVAVKNIGNHAGADVVQVYYTPPYTPGGIEKAYVNLVAFEKTAILPPGESEVVTLTFTPYDMASYDCYDKNGNGFAGYELEKGQYYIKLMTDSHTLKEGLKGIDSEYITYEVDEDIRWEKDPVTGNTVENRFTGETAYAGVPIDGSNVGAEATYMTRADFAGTFPTKRAKTPNEAAKIDSANKYVYTGFNTTELPTYGVDNGLRLVQKKTASGDLVFATASELEGNIGENEELVVNMELAKDLSDYDNPIWEDFLDQLNPASMLRIVESSGFGSIAIPEIGKMKQVDLDGPAGFNANVSGRTGAWTAFPSETLIGCTWNKLLCFEMGLSMGMEGKATGVNGWYAPGVNLHRSPYTARNFEYYSEDGVLSGKLAAELIYGCKVNGLYTFIKHYVVSEPGPNPRNVNTWLTEQNLRENYLRPFELAVKEGKTVALMTAFNRVGCVWAGACKPLNIDILRDEWGFRGVVLTDWSTGEGLGAMNPKQGVRAGNDMWLNPNTSSGSPLSRSGADYPTDLTLARQATKNCVYAFVDTYYLSATIDRSEIDSRFNKQLGIVVPKKPFDWWVIVIAAIDVLALAGSAVWIFFLFKPKQTLPV